MREHNHSARGHPGEGSTAGDSFRAAIGGATYTDRPQAADRLRQYLLHGIRNATAPMQPSALGVVAELGGHAVTAELSARRYGHPLTLALALNCVPRTSSVIETDILYNDDIGLIRQLENKVAALPEATAAVQTEISRAQAAIAEARQQQDKPFKHTQALSEARRRVDTINGQMNHATSIAAPTAGQAALSAAHKTEQALATTRAPFEATITKRPDAPGRGR